MLLRFVHSIWETFTRQMWYENGISFELKCAWWTRIWMASTFKRRKTNKQVERQPTNCRTSRIGSVFASERSERSKRSNQIDTLNIATNAKNIEYCLLRKIRNVRKIPTTEKMWCHCDAVPRYDAIPEVNVLCLSLVCCVLLAIYVMTNK